MKRSKVWKDKMSMSMLENAARENKLKGELNREYYDEENTWKFLCLLKEDK